MLARGGADTVFTLLVSVNLNGLPLPPLAGGDVREACW